MAYAPTATANTVAVLLSAEEAEGMTRTPVEIVDVRAYAPRNSIGYERC
jgi:hypothetical protein